MNKKFIQLTLIANFIICVSFGQVSYSNYIDTTSEWKVRLEAVYFDFGCNDFAVEYSDIIYFISGDTLLGADLYHKLYINRKDSTVCSGQTVISDYTSYSAAIREDSIQRVYRNNGISEALIWDFDISIGDTVRNDCVVSAIDTVWLGNRALKKFHCDCTDNNIIIEGVGASSGFLDAFFCAVGIEFDKRLICYKKQNDIIQIDSSIQCGLQIITETHLNFNDDFAALNIFPNPAVQEITLELNPQLTNSEPTIKLLNIFGQTLELVNMTSPVIKLDLSNLPIGIYFIDCTLNQMREVKRVIKR